MTCENQVQIKDKFCLTIDEAAAYFNIGQKKLRKIVTENLDSGFVIDEDSPEDIMDVFGAAEGDADDEY